MNSLQDAWAIYRRFVATGVVVGALTYGVFTVAGGHPVGPFLALTVPLIIAFCLAVSIPLCAVALVLIRALERGFGPQPKEWWLTVGSALGAGGVAFALMCFLSVGALANASGRLFWFTFLIAAAIAGGQAAWVMQRERTSKAA